MNFSNFTQIFEFTALKLLIGPLSAPPLSPVGPWWLCAPPTPQEPRTGPVFALPCLVYPRVINVCLDLFPSPFDLTYDSFF